MSFVRARLSLTRLLVIRGSATLVLIVGSMLFTSILPTSSVLAYNTEGCYWSGGGYISYENHGSNSGYVSDMQQAEYRWNTAGTNVNYSSVYSSPDVNIYYGNYGNTGWDGITYYTCGTTFNVFSPPSTVEGNTYYFSQYSYDYAVQVYVHELGHVLGLAHNNPPLCDHVPIMYYSSARYTSCGIDTPQADDIAGAKFLYG
ncbi:MAG: matrixin family metalloprotease [Candidatus Dormibacteria bacterium]